MLFGGGSHTLNMEVTVLDLLIDGLLHKAGILVVGVGLVGCCIVDLENIDSRRGATMSSQNVDPLTREELAELLDETGHHHHQAYADADGVDPEWALWYAGYLQTRMWDRAGMLPTRSQLVYLLIRGESELANADTDMPWPQYYAEAILAALGPAD